MLLATHRCFRPLLEARDAARILGVSTTEVRQALARLRAEHEICRPQPVASTSERGAGHRGRIRSSRRPPDDERGRRWCALGQHYVDRELFFVNRKNADGLHNSCAPCSNAYQKRWRDRRKLTVVTDQ